MIDNGFLGDHPPTKLDGGTRLLFPYNQRHDIARRLLRSIEGVPNSLYSPLDDNVFIFEKLVKLFVQHPLYLQYEADIHSNTLSQQQHAQLSNAALVLRSNSCVSYREAVRLWGISPRGFCIDTRQHTQRFYITDPSLGVAIAAHFKSIDAAQNAMCALLQGQVVTSNFDGAFKLDEHDTIGCKLSKAPIPRSVRDRRFPLQELILLSDCSDRALPACPSLIHPVRALLDMRLQDVHLRAHDSSCIISNDQLIALTQLSHRTNAWQKALKTYCQQHDWEIEVIATSSSVQDMLLTFCCCNDDTSYVEAQTSAPLQWASQLLSQTIGVSQAHAANSLGAALTHFDGPMALSWAVQLLNYERSLNQALARASYLQTILECTDTTQGPPVTCLLDL